MSTGQRWRHVPGMHNHQQCSVFHDCSWSFKSLINRSGLQIQRYIGLMLSASISQIAESARHVAPCKLPEKLICGKLRLLVWQIQLLVNIDGA